jgi:peptidoglycan/xylan/chitin deacetylase (PgdA/CDA1 family)
MDVTNKVKIRRWVKSILASTLYRSGCDKLIGRGFANGGSFPLVLGYHRVVDNFAAHVENSVPGLLTSQRMLERHLDWLGTRFRFVSLDELERELEGRPAGSKPAVALTFDDGDRNFYEYAFPLLKRKGVPAAVFVVTGLVGSSEVLFDQRLYLLLRAFLERQPGPDGLSELLRSRGIRQPELVGIDLRRDGPFPAMSRLLHALAQADVFGLIEALEEKVRIGQDIREDLRSLDWAMLAEMLRAGITIGSHTQTHALLPNESFSKVLDEIFLSRQEIERRLAVRADHFAYPCGRFNPLVVSAVAAAEYRFAYTICQHRDPIHPRLTIPRVMLWENSCLGALRAFSPAVLSCHVNGIFAPWDGCRQNHSRPWPPAEVVQDAAA